MKRRFITFFTLLATVFGMATFYVASRFIEHFDWLAQHQPLIWSLVIIFVLSQVLGPFIYRTFTRLPRQISWTLYFLQGAFLTLFFYTLVADVLLLLYDFVLNPSNIDFIYHQTFLGVLGLAIISIVVGVSQVISGPKVVEVSIPMAGLPKELEGFRIVQISDLHVGPTIGRIYTDNVVRIANNLNADLIALTGDLVDGTVEGLRDSISPVGNLKSKYGSFFVPGNHEYYWNVFNWIAEIERLGATPLINSHMVLTHSKIKLVVGGITDYTAESMVPEHASDPKKALAGAPSDASVRILLAHQPASADDAAAVGFDLQLSGHTHAGQFFPFTMVVKLRQKLFRGLYRYKNMWVYVNQGTGYWGPPMRFLVPAEITSITLRSKT